VLICNDPDDFSRMIETDLPQTGPIMVLPWRAVSGNYFPKLDRLWTMAEQTIRVICTALHRKPDLVYATYGAIVPAGLLARFSSLPVVLRLMGIFPHHRNIAEGRHKWLGWLLRSRFAHVVCTEDGSDPSHVLPRLLGRDVPWSTRLNGCDAIVDPAGRVQPNPVPRILFLGRLESYKGCSLFLDAALSVLAGNPGAASFEMIGDGPMKAELQQRIDAAGLGGSIRLHGALPHSEVSTVLRDADVYVSVNLHGNLSNANLEALAAGLCMVVPSSDPETPLDTATDRILPADIVTRYDRDSVPESLAAALAELVADPARIGALRAATKALSATVLRSWTDCIAEDKHLLDAIAARKFGDAPKYTRNSPSISSNEAE
jgi:glycosyltransferase involved in cell wall biosynthesis